MDSAFKKKKWLPLAAIGVIALGGLVINRLPQREVVRANAPIVAPTLSALGRLQPLVDPIDLTAPTTGEPNARLGKLLVEEGDHVTPGQVVAILDSEPRLRSAVAEAVERLHLAQARLAQVEAGAKTGEINAQIASIAGIKSQWQGERLVLQATIKRFEAEVANAQTEQERFAQLIEEGATTPSQFDSKRLVWQRSQEQLKEARANLDRLDRTSRNQITQAEANLDRIKEIRPVDIAVAQAEVSSSQASLDRAKTNLAQATLKAPQAAQVLKIYTRPGETIGSQGILQLGQTQTMGAVLEVFEADIPRVKVGQKVDLTAENTPDRWQGVVTRVGVRVERQTVVNTDPAANIDSRVVEVRVQLSEPVPVEHLTNLQVIGKIQL